VTALDIDALRAALGDRAAAVDVVEVTGSTNADLLAAARAGAPDRTVLVAERQDAGRGRLDRSWVSPPGAGLTFSVLLRPSGLPGERVGWLPLLAGLSVVRAVSALSAVPVALKWPNDVLLGPDQAKCAGILAEADPVAPGGPAVVVGIGLNVSTAPADLPEGATSLHAAGARLDRGQVLAAVLTRLLDDEAAWRAVRGDPDAGGLRAAYRAACATLGRDVRVSLPDGSALLGRAEDLDPDGRLLLRPESGAMRAVAAGDVVHVRAR
jgi:BirA family biotin operon repressor/biotin-[acetyl-CoA-carboxylase] ligase